MELSEFDLLPAFHSCFVCGTENPAGLKIRYAVDTATGLVVGRVTPAETFCGFPGFLHGGVISAMLDDVMWWAASFDRATTGVTAQLNTNFLSPAPLPAEYTLKAVPVGGERRKFRVKGWLEDAEGKTVSEADGLYLMHSRAYFEEVYLPEISFAGVGERVRRRYVDGLGGV